VAERFLLITKLLSNRHTVCRKYLFIWTN